MVKSLSFFPQQLSIKTLCFTARNYGFTQTLLVIIIIEANCGVETAYEDH